MNERIHTLTFTSENGKIHRIEVPCPIPQGWQGGTADQLGNSAQAIDNRKNKLDPRWRASQWVLDHFDRLK